MLPKKPKYFVFFVIKINNSSFNMDMEIHLFKHEKGLILNTGIL